jgi:hypothetical protein
MAALCRKLRPPVSCACRVCREFGQKTKQPGKEVRLRGTVATIRERMPPRSANVVVDHEVIDLEGRIATQDRVGLEGKDVVPCSINIVRASSL